MEWANVIRTRRSLLSRIKNWDDQQSWQEFHETYAGLIRRAACQAGVTESEADDVVQETMLAVFKRIRDFRYERERCTFRTWLLGVTRRQVGNQFRKRQGKGRRPEPLPLSDGETGGIDDLPDPASHALEELWDREWMSNLWQAAVERVKRKVSPAQFQIFDYRVLQEHNVAETVLALNVSSARVYLATLRLRRLVHREVARLRKQYL